MRVTKFVSLFLLVTASCSDDQGSVGTNTGGQAGSSTTSTTGGTGGTTGSGGTTETGGTAGEGGSGGTGGSVGEDDAGTDAGTPGGGSPEGGAVPGAGPASMSNFDWGKAVIDTAIGGSTSFGTSYPEGLILHGIYKAYKRTKDPRYLAFITNSANSYGTAGSGSLDGIMHNTTLANGFELTMKASYKPPADGTRRIFDNYPTTSEGGFWHAAGASRAHQLWGDGVFMSLSFLTRYSTVFNDPSVHKIAVTQITVTQKHLLNPATGLLWHAWDESGTVDWSQTPSKTNEISWGRAMGWFGLASVMTLEMLPDGAPGRTDVEKILADLVTAWKKFQDPATGRWFQVVDKGSDSRNWTETSASAMYSYVTWWAYQHKLVDESFKDVAVKGFNGVMQKITKDAANHTSITDICVGLNASSDLVGNYFNHGRATNDRHGIGSFILMWEGMQ